MGGRWDAGGTWAWAGPLVSEDPEGLQCSQYSVRAGWLTPEGDESRQSKREADDGAEMRIAISENLSGR